MANLWIKKPLAKLLAESNESGGLKRTLGSRALVSLGIGAIIGAGLFSITGGAAANNAGPAVTISFLIAAVACAFAGLCYAEFASMIPVAGSAYTYSYATMGEFIAWIIGWDLVLEYAVGAATVSISWSRYLQRFLGYYDMELSPAMTMSPFTTTTLAHDTMINGSLVAKDTLVDGELQATVVDGALMGGQLTDGVWQGAELVQGMINMPAVFIVVLMSLILIRGTRGSSRLNGIIVALKVAVVLIFIILGWGYINTANYLPYVPENTGNFGEFGFSGVVRAAAIIFFAFIGFDAVSTAAQEAKNPQKTMPIGILGSLAICTVLYLLFAHVMTGVTPYTSFAGQDGIAPVAVAIDQMGPVGPDGIVTPAYPWLNKAIIIAILAGYSSVIMVMLMGQSRVFFSMSKDGLLPSIFSRVHATFGTPARSNLIIMLFVSLFAAFVPVRVVGEMTSIGTLLAFALVCIGVMIMRKNMPNAPRAFRTPWVPFVPIMGVLSCVFMMAFLPADTWLRLIIWLAIGMVIYFFYSRKRSKLRLEEEGA
ncbi:MAG: amino acid permease [Flavobacteriales bacterium]|nr:amino acid permease [Flavobacteriales bacterium]